MSWPPPMLDLPRNSGTSKSRIIKSAKGHRTPRAAGRPQEATTTRLALDGCRPLLLPLEFRQSGDQVRPTLLQKVGKLVNPARLNAVAAGMLVHITDQLTDGRYLVDTGASFSLVPHKSSAPPPRSHASPAPTAPTYGAGGRNLSMVLPPCRCLLPHPGGGLPAQQQAPSGRSQQHASARR